MQDYTEQHLDKLAKKVMQSVSLERPSLDFTANIMAKVETASISSNITAYQPLISRRTWIIVSLLVIGLLVYSVFGNTTTEGLGWFDKFDFSIISNNKITETISGITFSKTLMYAVVLCGLVFFIQIPMMKYYLNKRLDY